MYSALVTGADGTVDEHLSEIIFPAEDVPSHVVRIPELDLPLTC